MIIQPPKETRLKLETWVISLVTIQMKYEMGEYGIHPKQDKLAQFRSPNSMNFIGF
jgi:hypothetical protein